MCKVWLIYYTCGHKLTERLSKCRATYKSQSAPGKAFYPACQGTAALCIDFKRLCGDCASRKREEELNEQLTKLALGTAERFRADEEYARESFIMSQTFPRLERKKSLKPLKIQLPTREMRGSLLKTEVLEEDIKEDISEMLSWEAYYNDWKTGPSYACDSNAETPPWESVETNGTEDSSDGGWASDNTFACLQTTVDPWAANDGNTQDTDLASTWAWGGENTTDFPPTCESQPASEILNQHDKVYTKESWTGETVEELNDNDPCKDTGNIEKDRKNMAFCVLIDSLSRSCSERLWLGSALV